MQGLHGLEHLVLMLTVWLGAPQAIGFSTWFGLLEPGPECWWSSAPARRPSPAPTASPWSAPGAARG